MLRLPGCISAQVQDVGGGRLAAADVLVGINFLSKGRYYYGNLIGLTDLQGGARITRSELELRFAYDRAAHPMDYKIDLEECDSLIELVLLSESEIEEARAAVAGNSEVSDEIRGIYGRAKNASYAPAVVRVWADLPGRTELVASVSSTHLGG